MSMQDFKDAVAMKIYGITLTEAHAKGICIDCKESMYQPIPYDSIMRNELTPLDVKEYKISGICPICWDKQFPPEKHTEQPAELS